MKLEQRASGYRIVARMDYLRAYMRTRDMIKLMFCSEKVIVGSQFHVAEV